MSARRGANSKTSEICVFAIKSGVFSKCRSIFFLKNHWFFERSASGLSPGSLGESLGQVRLGPIFFLCVCVVGVVWVCCVVCFVRVCVRRTTSPPLADPVPPEPTSGGPPRRSLRRTGCRGSHDSPRAQTCTFEGPGL